MIVLRSLVDALVKTTKVGGSRSMMEARIEEEPVSNGHSVS